MVPEGILQASGVEKMPVVLPSVVCYILNTNLQSKIFTLLYEWPNCYGLTNFFLIRVVPCSIGRHSPLVL